MAEGDAETLRRHPRIGGWVHALGIVRFDLQEGQVLDYYSPDDFPFTETDLLEVAFLGMPDSNNDVSEGVEHIDTTDTPSPTGSGSGGEDVVVVTNRTKLCIDSYHFTTTIGGFRPPLQLYGWSVYAQLHDRTVERGAVQRSMVLLSALPLPGVFEKVLQIAITEYMNLRQQDAAEEGSVASALLASCADQIKRWPPPTCCGYYPALPFLGKQISYSAPCFRYRGFTGVEVPKAGKVVQGRAHMLAVDDSSSSSETTPLATHETMHVSESFETLPHNTSMHSLDELVVVANRRSKSVSVEDDDAHVDISDLLASLRFRSAHRPTSRVTLGSSATEVAMLAVNIARAAAAAERTGTSGTTLIKPSSFSHARRNSSCPPPATSSARTSFRYKAPGCGHGETGGRFPFTDPGYGLPSGDRGAAALLEMHHTRLWKVWELLIAGESIAVVGDSAVTVSKGVRGLVSLIEPLPFGGDALPYINLHCHDIHKYSDGLPETPTVLGCTNPYFCKMFRHWPNMLTAGGSSTDTRTHRRSGSRLRKGLESSCTLFPQLFTDYPFALIPPAIPPGNYRTHFRSLTEVFLSPLHHHTSNVLVRAGPEIFVGSVWDVLYPLHSPQQAKAASIPPPFYSEDYIAAVRQWLPASPFAGPPPTPHAIGGRDVMSLYLAFLHTPTFLRWLAEIFRASYRAFLFSGADLPSLLLQIPGRTHRLALLSQLEQISQVENAAPCTDYPLVEHLKLLTPQIPEFRRKIAASK